MIITSCCCIISGLAFHAYQKEWIIFLFPHQNMHGEEINDITTPSYSQQKIILFFWKQDRWHQEYNHVIWSSNIERNIQTITHNWLILMEDEKLIETDIQLISTVVTAHKELFLSFNKNLCENQESTYKKLMIMHGLLKTLHENKVAIQSIRFLVHHQSMTDDHLNFTISWPITGYVQEKIS